MRSGLHAAAAALFAALLLTGALSWRAASATTLFGLLSTGELYASADGGASWDIRSTLPVRDAVALAAGDVASKLFLASASGSFYRSLDGGASWTAVAAVPASDVVGMVVRLETILLVTSTGSVYSSLDGGTSFTAVGAIAASDVVGVTRLANVYFALTRSGGVYSSGNTGTTWAAVGTIVTSEAAAIAALGSHLYVLTSTGDIAASDYLGTAWAFVGTLSQTGMSGLTAGSGELMAATEAGEVAASVSGASWTWRGAIGQLTVRALATDVPSTTGVGPSPALAFRFAAPWPNPATSSVVFTLDLESGAETTLEVFDAAGRLVDRPMKNERLAAGRTVRVWRPGLLPAGAYYVHAQVGGRRLSHRLIWLAGR